MDEKWTFYSSNGILLLQSKTVGRSDVGSILRPDTMKGYFMMQPHSILQPYFPENLDDYAPWVSTHGLTAPYGECQCGCGCAVPIATGTVRRHGRIKGEPIRFVHSHNTRMPRGTAHGRFWKSVIKGTKNECWEWQGTRHVQGYGTIGVRGKTLKAHRFSWELHNGEIPDDMEVCHKCDNPPCVNPFHLFLGSHQDNIDDMVAKRRNSWGERHPRAKLTIDDVIEIRSRVAAGEMQVTLAKEKGVSPCTIRGVISGRNWRNVP